MMNLWIPKLLPRTSKIREYNNGRLLTHTSDVETVESMEDEPDVEHLAGEHKYIEEMKSDPGNYQN